MREASHNLNSLATFLVKTLNTRYKRVRLYACNPHNKVYYGYLSTGMDDDFKEKFDSFPHHPFENDKYKIKFDEVPVELSEKVSGTEETYLLCNKKIRGYFANQSLPPFVNDLSFGTLINHSLTIHIMAAQSVPLGAVSIDFGNLEDTFSYEECQFLDAFVGTYFGQLLAPFLVREFRVKIQGIKSTDSIPFKDSSSPETENSFYRQYKLSQKFNIIYNGAYTNHPFDSVFTTIEKVKDANMSIFLNGETGTGKELIAKALHYYSERKGYSFKKISCGPLSTSSSTFQGELFGFAPDSGYVNPGLFIR